MRADTGKLQDAFGEGTVRLVDRLCFGAWGLVGLVVMFQALGIGAGPITSYGANIFGPIALWWTLRRTLLAPLRFGAEIATATLWGGCCFWEICQYFDLSGTVFSVTEGTFDPIDLMAYTVAVFGCYLLDKLFGHRHRSDVEVETEISNAA